MAFSSFSMALAAGDAVVVEATQSNEQMAGDFLKAAGVLKGDDKGNLNLDQALTREQAMLMIAKLMGKEDEALNFKGQSTFKDAKNNAYWAPVIAWAEAQKLTNGMGDGTFGLGKEATKNQVVTMYLRVLGYEVTWAGKELSADSQKVVEETGLLTAVGETFNRGAMAVMTVNTLKATPKGAETTLAKNLNVDMTKAPKFVTPSKPGEIGDAKVESVKAIANDKIEVKFDKEVSAAAADFKVTEKADATKVIEVKEAKMESAKVAVLTVEALTSGKAYAVKVGESTVNFTGVAKVTVAPVVKTVKGTDFNRVEIEFEKAVDKETAETVANYVIEKATVVKATLNADRNKVTLETEGLVKNTLYKMTIENVKSVDAVAMKKVSKSFRAIEDTVAPKVSVVNIRNNETITIQFSKEMDKATLENVENYKITSSLGNIDVVSAKASASASDKTNDVVTLKTATQDVKATYTLTVDGVKDASVKANALTKFTRTFRGFAADTVAPTVTKAEGIHNTLVKVEVSEANLLDKASVEDISNYSFDRDLSVVSVELVADKNKYGEATKEILITTSAQKANTSYKLTVKGIMDEFGNALKPLSGTNYRQYGFVGKDEDKSAAIVEKINSLGPNKLEILFNEELNKATAQDPTNYVLDGNLGAATKATLSKDAKKVTLETPTQTVGKTYTVTINGVQDKYAGNAMVDVKAKVVTVAVEADTTAPVLAYVYAPNNQELHMAFDKAVVKNGQTVQLVNGATTLNFTVKDIIADDTVLVFGADNATMTGIEYTVTNTALTIQSKSNNLVKYDFKAEPVKVMGNAAANTAPTTSLADIEQTAANKFKVTFDKNVSATGITVDGATVSKVENGDTRNVLILTTNVLEAGKTLKWNFTTVTDVFGNASKDKDLQFVTYIAKPEKPVMVNAIAVNNVKVQLTFTEQINGAGTYKLYTIDTTDGKTEKNVQTVIGKVNADDETIVDLALTTALKGEEVYYVKYVTAPTNISNAAADTKADPMSFQGTDVKPNANYVSGVTFTNTKKIVVKDAAGEKIAPTAISEIAEMGSTTTTPQVIVAGYNAAGTEIVGHFYKDKYYRVQTAIGSFDFAGIKEVASTEEAAAVAADKAALNLATPVTANIVLPTTGTASASSITWTSALPNVISDSGVVTRQAVDTLVTMTALITSGSAQDVKEIAVTVTGLPLVATADMALVLTTPAPGVGNTITVGGATKTGDVNVVNTTASVVLTGTKTADQTVAIGGANAAAVAAAGTATTPTYTINTDDIKAAGGTKTFTLTVSEPGKANIVYTVTVIVAAP